MSKFHSYITSATRLINTYSAGKPLSLHIKSFFAADKKFGSRDRRMISSLCYYYFRTGNAFKKNTLEEKILAGLFLCENKNNELLQFFRPDLDAQIALPVADKMLLMGIEEKDIFSFRDQLSEEIVCETFSISFLKQPQLYLRIRPGRKKRVIEKLNEASVVFEWPADDCLLLANNSSVEKIVKLNKDAVVQDINSQKVLDHLDKSPGLLQSTEKKAAWDCCAASGGKSILLYDKLKGNIKLTVSDIRKNILVNLHKRLQQAGININRDFITDLSVSSGLEMAEKFSVIICDTPCTGSGTWSRTPEQLFFFNENSIDVYAERQQQIVSNVIPHLNTGGLFFYITCSVFKKENEEMVSFIKEKNPLLQLMQMEYFKGYENAADTMFVAVFQLS